MNNKRYSYPWVVLVLLGLLSATLMVCTCLLVFTKSDENLQQNVGEDTQESAYESSDITEVELEKLDFQPVIDEWAKSTRGSKSVVIYDLDLNENVGEYNSEEEYLTASLYKLFVVYEGYLLVENGEWEMNTRAGVTGHTIGECLDLAIRESNSPCAETLREMIGEYKLDKIIKQNFGITHSDISGYMTTAEDVAKMMQIYYQHDDIKDMNLIAQMKDSFLNQPITEYDWRQGLPSGFNKANIYNKVGWEYNEAGYWEMYHDAAIVEFPEEGRHFVVVVMTNNIAPEQIRQFGKMIEKVFYENS